MLFSTMTFIYVFLPIVCTLYLLIRKELRNHLLLLASLIFYAWGEPKYLLVMLSTIGVNYIFALLIESTKDKNSDLSGEQSTSNKGLKQHTPLICLIIALVINLSILGYFKYFNFLCENINLLFKANIDFIKVVMPIGISFYTFQAISYLVDVYRGDTRAQRNIYKLALFISLFPQLIAGPIVKYHDVNEQIDHRDIDLNDISYGIKRFIIGLSKKMLIANTFGEIADKVFNQDATAVSPGIAWIGAIAYTLQIFFDFSGYSDMAIGLGRIFGFKFKENFNYPYISKTISEFWRRWHISLSTWFKEYLYIPLGGNRKSPTRTYINLSIVFLATGIWHGAAWNFICWGIWNGLFIVIERFFGLNREKNYKWYQSFMLHVYCILAFIIGWVMFRAPDMNYALTYIGNMFGLVEHKEDLYKAVYYIDVIPALTLIAAIVCSLPVFKNIIEKTNKRPVILWFFNAWLYVLLILSTAVIASSTYNPFIYFRF